MRYPTVLQHSEEDCGAACLATVARYHGRLLAIGHAREVVGTGQLGTTLLGLERGVQALGFLIRVQAIMQRLAEVLEATPETDQDGAKPWVTLSAQGDMVCTNLSFHYPGRQEVLQNLAMTIPGGQVTAIVGASGCGKSTLAKLLASLYRPQGGQLRLGNFNQGDLALECWRQQVVLVPQEAHFWTRTILQNFRLSHPQASFEAIVAACQITGADAFISQLPDQYRTILGEFGANLSGGQKQRLALKPLPRSMVDGAIYPRSKATVLKTIASE